MNITAVESTTLSVVAYDEAQDALRLEFRSGAIYHYFGVPVSVPVGLLASMGTRENGSLLARNGSDMIANAASGGS